ncbi:cellulose synthase family protein [Marinoscillum sp. MHG1-6]|uniref:cellulose synthase family protein n=1 Tax=Marinoscillum sp. MHG1-6 TaxID=2959627 RepID=UPI002157463C|nr:cellulose synthase family protein [Marinoscillum sp. MHG1-6]
MDWLIIGGYSIALTVICVFSAEQLYLAWIYSRSKKNDQRNNLKAYPYITVQLPIYNEKYVINRLIDKVCQLDYPTEKLEIQVLDDSDDETLELTTQKVTEWSDRGMNIKLVRRPNRIGYKAGALAYGMGLAQGEFIAIFDADFLPEKDFLTQTISAFDQDTGMVQTKWGHINQDYSILTRMQAFGLNAHFTVEQTGRSSSGKLMNFNGTAGVWRKTCIEEAGGWQHDTLTEDLDLSYRAQLKGWKFKYLEDVTTPAELPVIIPAIKSQQYRWNKGAAETARKNLASLFRSKLSFKVKFHGLMHLLNSSIFIFLLIGAVLSIPLLQVKHHRTDLSSAFDLAIVFIIGFLGTTIFYWISARVDRPRNTWKYFIYEFPIFLTFCMGLSLHNAIAVAEGYLGRKTPFIRTPKFNITSSSDTWKGNKYLNKALSPVLFIEGLLSLYFLYGIYYGIKIEDYGLILFHLMLSIGFGAVFYLTLRSK